MSFVIKRNGLKEAIRFDKISERINKLINIDEKEYLDEVLVAQKVVNNIYSGITTEELDIQSAEICVNLSTKHPLYSQLGGKILVSNLHKKTTNSFSDKVSSLKTILDDKFVKYVLQHKTELDNMIDYNRDYMYDYFGFKTLERAYLLKLNNNIIERPQDMLMRVAITLQFGNLEKIKQTYDYMSLGFYTHASPTMFNAGTKHMQLSSCFLEDTEIMTKNGVKKIQNVLIGDEVITHTGKFKKVLQTHVNPLNDRIIYKLNVENTKPIYVTGNHKFLCKTENDEQLKWIPVEEMNNKSEIIVPNYKGQLIEDFINLNERVYKIDSDMAILIGIFLGCGQFYYINDNIVGIEFILKNDKTIHDFIIKTLSKNFESINFIFTENKNTKIKYVELICKSELLGKLFEYMFKNDFNNPHYSKNELGIIKKICPTNIYNNMINWNYQLIYNLFDGLIKSTSLSYDESLKILLSNYTLANELYHLFRMFNINVFVDKLNYMYYTLNTPKINNLDTKTLKVLTIHETDIKPDFVYTLGVEDDHSYNVEGLICENCFLLGTSDDLTSITTTWDSCAQISKWAGGIGLHVSNIRGKDSLIKGTNGKSNGLVPFLRVFNDIARWIDQGGKRPGSIAIYLEPHHPDIFEFLDLRKNFGSETERARDLFLALWISDLFMKQVDSDGDWYLLSADECPNLNDVYGEEYELLYWNYVKENKYRKVIKARKLWLAILESQIETGMPYIGYKDSVNKKSNQKNIGTIKSSNLCIEIAEYSDDKEYAVCNLASISLKSFIKKWEYDDKLEWTIYTKPNCKYCKYAKSFLLSNKIKFTEIEFNDTTVIELKNKLCKEKITYPQIFIGEQNIGGWSELYKYTASTFDYDKLYDVAYLATINLNQVIDINYYPVPQTKYSNLRHRPIGLGIQGLADALVLMKIPFDSEEAIEFNKKYMETIYAASMTSSNDMAKDRSIKMRELIIYLNENEIKYPDYYSSEFKLFDEINNKYYHELKPNKWELERNPEDSTIGSYCTFNGSPLSEGKFQFDLWNEKPINTEQWSFLRESVKQYGTRNSLLTALMPTASTSQILGNNECFEYFTNNIYTRKTQAGDFILVNKYLVDDLIKINMWSNELKDRIIGNDGSIQSFNDIPQEFKDLYKTVWEIKQIWVLKGAVARGPYVDQTQSMNIFMGEPDYQRLGSSHFWAWKNGLKTGMYYLRTKPAANAIKFTVDPTLIKKTRKLIHPENTTTSNTLNNCENCSA